MTISLNTVAVAIAAAGTVASAQTIHSRNGHVWAESVSQEIAINPDGTPEEMTMTTITRPICGSAPMTDAQFAEVARIHAEAHAAFDASDKSDVIVVDALQRRTGLNIVFNLFGSVPSGAATSFAQAEAYIESFFDDDITVEIDVTFANLGNGVLGATGNTNTNRSYTQFRDALVADADADDVLPALLPSGSLPVRLNASNSTVTQETDVTISRANGKAVGFQFFGGDSDMTYNSNFNWDFDPTNGLSFSAFSLVDTVVHEVGHSMGFVSAVDFGNGTFVQPMDFIRFVTSGAFDPNSFNDFTTVARSVDFNNPNSGHTLDVITAEYRAEDGTPFQASHFREQGNNIGIMDAAGANGETFVNRNPFGYYTQADLDVFDFLGFDRADCEAPVIDTQPVSQGACDGFPATLSVSAPTAVEFQWVLNGNPISNGTFFSGADTDTLQILNVNVATAGTYTCEVTNAEDCTAVSSPAEVTVNTPPVVLIQPTDAVVDEGDEASFTAIANNVLGFQWTKDGQPLSDGPNIVGATTTTLRILSATPADEGNYRMIANNGPGCESLTDIVSLTVNATGPTPCNEADVAAPFNVLDLTDVDTFIAAFLATDPAADIAAPFGVIDLTDIDAFIAAFLGGCP